MSTYTPYYSVLDESVALYGNMLEFEKSKYQVLLQKDVAQLEEMLKVEQAMIMRADVLEKKRSGLQKALGQDGLTLLELADTAQAQDKTKLLSYRTELLSLLENIKKLNAQSMELVKIRLNKAQVSLEHSGYVQDMHTYDGTGTVTGGNAGIQKNIVTKNV